MSPNVHTMAMQGVSVRRPDIFFVLFMVLLSLTGLVSYEQTNGAFFRSNLLPANALLDMFIVLYVFAVPATRFTPVTLFFLAVSSLYVLLSALFLPIAIEDAPTPIDVILSFKPFIYLIILSFARPHSASVSLDTLEKVFKYLLVACFVKYVVAKIVMGIPRPGLFTENNFELAFFLVLFIFLSRSGRLGSRFWVLLLLAVVLISGSRSGLLALMAALMTSARKGLNRLIIAVTVVPVMLLGIMLFANTRIAGIGDLAQIDRFFFMQMFLEELQRFDLWNYVVGWAPMTPLSNATCGRLAFYDSLFSGVNDSICYSVILHVFYFRVILDHGFLGLAFLIWGFYGILRHNGLSRSLSLAILMQGMINGLSVSGLANTYFVFAMVLVISYYPGRVADPKERASSSAPKSAETA